MSYYVLRYIYLRYALTIRLNCKKCFMNNIIYLINLIGDVTIQATSFQNFTIKYFMAFHYKFSIYQSCEDFVRQFIKYLFYEFNV